MNEQRNEVDAESIRRRLQARKLLAAHAALRGFPGEANWLSASLREDYFAVPRSERPSFLDYVLQLLGSPS